MGPAEPTAPLLVIGTAGAGKSAVMAKCAADAFKLAKENKIPISKYELLFSVIPGYNLLNFMYFCLDSHTSCLLNLCNFYELCSFQREWLYFLFLVLNDVAANFGTLFQ